jgi:hypothetical protein
MCIVIDINCISSVFGRYIGKKVEDYEDFEPIGDWLHKKNTKAKMVYGGTKYRAELGKLTEYLGYLKELKTARRIAEINDSLVDKKKVEIEHKVKSNDPHLIAILSCSGCRLLCSKDKKTDEDIKEKSFYPHGKKTKIYRCKEHSHLLCDKNIVELRNTV